MDLRAWIDYADPGGPLHRAIDPEWWATRELRFLRDISDSLSWLVWAQSEESKHGRPPKRTLLTMAEHRQSNPDHGRWTALPIEEIDALLGLKGGDSGRN